MSRNVPLWMRNIPKYPLYWPGDPQLRILLPLFWMKLVKPQKEVPPDRVHFITHPQMSKHDIKQYLEKIYKVPVLKVTTTMRQGEEETFNIKRHGKHSQIKKPGEFYKLAFVQLAEGHTFKFPDIFKEKDPQKESKQMEEDLKKLADEKERASWDRAGLPLWFGY